MKFLISVLNFRKMRFSHDSAYVATIRSTADFNNFLSEIDKAFKLDGTTIKAISQLI